MPRDVMNPVLVKTFDTASAVTRGRLVKQSVGDNICAPFSAAADVPIGVAIESVTTGEIAKGKGVPVGMRGSGIYPMEAGAAIAEGAQVVADATGRAVTLGTASAGTIVVGICHMGVSAAGRMCSVQFL